MVLSMKKCRNLSPLHRLVWEWWFLWIQGSCFFI